MGQSQIPQALLDAFTLRQARALFEVFAHPGNMVNGLLVKTQSGDLSTAADELALYTKDVGGAPRLFLREESDGTVIQISASGAALNIPGYSELTSVDGANDFLVIYDASGAVHKKVKPDNLPGGGGGGETNTASNVNVGGVGVFKQKTGVDLEFRGVNAASSKISVALDAANNEIDLDVAEANLTLDNIGGTLGISKGGTGQTAKTAAFDALAPGTTKGDLLVFNGTDHVRLAAGTNGYRLEADSTSAEGVKWVTSGIPDSNPYHNIVWLGASSGAVVAKGLTRYIGTDASVIGPITGEEAFVTFPSSGTVKNLYVFVNSNTTSAAGNKVDLVKSAVPPTVLLSTTFNSGETGWKSDTGSASVTAGDVLGIQVQNTGSGGGAKDLSIAAISFEFSPS